MHVAVLGAGLTGLVAARRLARSGTAVDVFDRQEAVGGLIRSTPVDGGHFDLSGGHYLPLADATARRWAADVLEPDRWAVRRPAIRFLDDGRLWRRIPVRAIPGALGAVARRGDPPTGLVERLRWTYGTTLARDWLQPWSARLWGADPAALEAPDGPPLPGAPPVGPITLAWLRRNAPMLWDARASQPMGYPVDGMQAFADAHLAGIRAVHTGVAVERLQRRPGGWHVNGEGPYSHLISTVHPAVLTAAVADAPDAVRAMAGRLRVSSTTVGYFARDRAARPAAPDRMWFVVRGRGPFNRAVLRFEERSGTDAVLADAAGRIATDDLRAAGAALGFGRLIEVHHTPHAFPLPLRGARADADAVGRWGQETGIDQAGRWTWRPSSMVSAIHEGLRAADRIAAAVAPRAA